MDPNMITELIQLAISLANTHVAGRDVARILLEIIRKGVQAYEDQTGEALNPALIRPERTI
jgi:hypothetical protein